MTTGCAFADAQCARRASTDAPRRQTSRGMVTAKAMEGIDAQAAAASASVWKLVRRA